VFIRIVWDLQNDLYQTVFGSSIVNNVLAVKVVGIDKVSQFLNFCFIPHLFEGQGDKFINKMLRADIPYARELSIIFGIIFVASSAKIITDGAFNYIVHILQL